jgi:DNA-binding MarR family transcriptional regulator
MIARYLEVIRAIESVHRNYIQVIKEELDRLGLDGVNTLQALVLFNVGDAEITVNGLRNRINYLGSHFSSLLKELVNKGYLLHENSDSDRRATGVSLSNKGRALYDKLVAIHNRRMGVVADLASNPSLECAVWTLRQIEQFWIEQKLDW